MGINPTDYYLELSPVDKFHVKVWVPSENPGSIVFLLHGLADHSGRFDHVAEAFCNAGHIFIAPDLRGNGLTTGKRGHFESIDQIIGDIDFIINHFRKSWPDIPLVIYGQSMGGNLALNYGLRRQASIQLLISSSPWLHLANPPAKLVAFAGNLLGYIMPSLTIPNGINAFELCHDQAICKAYEKDPLVHGKISLNTYRIITEAGVWALENAQTLGIPLLLLHGTSDRITLFNSSQSFASNNSPYCTFKSYEGLFHELHNEPEREQILAFILNWLNQQLENIH
ncbi:MAG: alpha/beta hydrolase [Bacteroidales bacterium]|nr:alpha/beta hydrolase [Bacteroidales bacterium]